MSTEQNVYDQGWPALPNNRIRLGQQNNQVPTGRQNNQVPPGQQNNQVPTGQQKNQVPPGQQNDQVPPGQQNNQVPPGQQINQEQRDSRPVILSEEDMQKLSELRNELNAAHQHYAKTFRARIAAEELEKNQKELLESIQQQFNKNGPRYRAGGFSRRNWRGNRFQY